MATKSDVYIITIDESYQAVSSNVAAPLIPMRLKKGARVEEVNIQNFKEKIGYDLEFNQNYYALNDLLAGTSYAYIYRMEHDTTFANVIVTVDGLETFTFEDITDEDALLLEVLTLTEDIEITASPQAFDVSSKIKPGTMVIYDATGVTVLAQDDGAGVLAEVGGSGVSGTITDYALGTGSLTTGAGLPITYKFSWTYNSAAAFGFVLKTRGDWIDGSIAIVEDTGITYFKFYEKTGPASYSEKESIEIVLDDITSDDWIVTKVNANSDYVTVLYGDTLPSFSEIGGVTPVDLENGSDGDEPTAVDFLPEDLLAYKDNFFFIVTNGVLDIGIVAKLGQYAASYNKFMLYDAPYLTTYSAVKAWNETVTFKDKLMFLSSIVDIYTIDGEEILVYPSVKTFLCYVYMKQQSTYLNYPPAGPIYGRQAFNQMQENDFDLYGDELKTNNINYYTRRNGAVMLWEQRTQNPAESDFSYASAVITHLNLVAELKSFTDNYPFQFLTPDKLNNIEIGLQSIGDRYIANGFVNSFSVTVPDESSKEVDIYVEVQYAEDGEVFRIYVNVQ